MSGRVVHVSDNVPGAVYIGRAMPRRGLKTSPLANPFKIGVHGDRAACVQMYRVYLMSELVRADPALVDPLIACRDRPLACWCRHDGEDFDGTNGCHGDIIRAVLDHNSDDAIRAGRARLRRNLT